MSRRLEALLLAAPLETITAGDGGGFPCATDEWVANSWHPPEEVICRSCYECDAGQVCFRRGGCYNCTVGEYDADRDPMHGCVPCPEGKTSEEAATACTEIELSVWQKFVGLDESLQGVIGVSMLAIISFLLFLVCDSCCPSTRSWLTRKWTEYSRITGGEHDEAVQPEPELEPEAAAQLGSAQEAAGVQREEESFVDTAPLVHHDAFRVDTTPASETSSTSGTLAQVNLFGPCWNLSDGRWVDSLFVGSFVAGSDGALYCAPYNAKWVLKVDPRTSPPCTSCLDLRPILSACDAEGCKWYGSLVARRGDTALYCAPGYVRAAGGVLRVDPTAVEPLSTLELPPDSTTDRINQWVGSFAADGADGNDLFCAPCNAKCVLRVNGYPATTSCIDLPNYENECIAGQEEKWVGSLVPGSNIATSPESKFLYCAPKNAPGVLLVDTSSSTANLLPLPIECDCTSEGKWVGNLVQGADHALYCAPWNAPGVLRVDPGTRATSLVQLPPGCSPDEEMKWTGSFVPGVDGALYCAPFNAPGILRVDCSAEPATTSLIKCPEGKWVGDLVPDSDDGKVLYCAPEGNCGVLRLEICVHGPIAARSEPQYMLGIIAVPPECSGPRGYSSWSGSLVRGTANDAAFYCAPKHATRALQLTLPMARQTTTKQT